MEGEAVRRERREREPGPQAPNVASGFTPCSSGRPAYSFYLLAEVAACSLLPPAEVAACSSLP